MKCLRVRYVSLQLDYYFRCTQHAIPHQCRLKDDCSDFFQCHPRSPPERGRCTSFRAIRIEPGAHRECDVRDWEENLNRLISDPSARKQRKIQMWLARQHRLAASGHLEPTRNHKLWKHGIDVDLLHCINRGKQRPRKIGE
jgi:hypothetical protein